MFNTLSIKAKFLFWIHFFITQFRINLTNTFSKNKPKIEFHKVRVGDKFLYYQTPLKGLLKKQGLNNSIEYKGFAKKGYTEKVCIEDFHVNNNASYLHSTNGKHLWNNALSIYQEFAKNGIPEAYNNLGILYCFAHAGIDYKKRFKLDAESDNSVDDFDYKKCFELAAESGVSEAMLNLAFGCYLNKKENPTKEKYFYWLNKAALKENPIALYDLAVSYHFGLDLVQNLTLAEEYYIGVVCTRYKNKEADWLLKRIRKKAICNLVLMSQK